MIFFSDDCLAAICRLLFKYLFQIFFFFFSTKDAGRKKYMWKMRRLVNVTKKEKFPTIEWEINICFTATK